MRQLRARNYAAQQLCLQTPTREALRQAHLNEYDSAIVTGIFDLLPGGIPQEGVPYDLVVRPEMYGQAYLQLAELYENENLPMFQIVPLSTSLIPRHIPIDTTILCHHVLGMACNGSALNIGERKFHYWRQVFNLNHHSFKKRSGMKFEGYVQTDGISLSVNIQKPQLFMQRKRKREHQPRQQSEYFWNNIPELKQEKVFIDPSRRDLLYCLGSNDQKLRYTAMQRRSETKAKEHDRIRTNIEVAALLRGPIIRPGQRTRVPSANLPSKSTVNQEYFCGYLAYFFHAMARREEVYGREVFRKLKFNK